MTTRHLLDPEILPALDAFPQVSLQKEYLPSIREAASAQVKLVELDELGITRTEIHVAGLAPDQPDVRCLLYRPKAPKPGSGAYLHLHGGGYILGSADASDQHNSGLAAQLGITIISVDYRLAPEHPAPAALLDGYAALGWLHENAAEFGIDPTRIAIGGESAGGGLAAALAIYARDQGEFPICFQLLTYPMLDDRTGSESNPGDPLTGEFVWTRDRNQLGWSYYLGESEPSAPVVPAREKNLEGLPATWLSTAALDLFRGENIVYAERLMAAGVATELIVYPRTCHGFQLARDASVTGQFLRDHAEALSRAFA